MYCLKIKFAEEVHIVNNKRTKNVGNSLLINNESKKIWTAKETHMLQNLFYIFIHYLEFDPVQWEGCEFRASAICSKATLSRDLCPLQAYPLIQ